MIAIRGFVRRSHSLRVRRSLFPSDAEALRAEHRRSRLALTCVLVSLGYRIPCSRCFLSCQYWRESHGSKVPEQSRSRPLIASRLPCSQGYHFPRQLLLQLKHAVLLGCAGHTRRTTSDIFEPTRRLCLWPVVGYVPFPTTPTFRRQRFCKSHSQAGALAAFVTAKPLTTGTRRVADAESRARSLGRWQCVLFPAEVKAYYLLGWNRCFVFSKPARGPGARIVHEQRLPIRPPMSERSQH
jgi:hypothetical protein